MKIVEIAKGEIGVEESPKNSNKTKYGKWFGLDGVTIDDSRIEWFRSHYNSGYVNP